MRLAPILLAGLVGGCAPPDGSQAQTRSSPARAQTAAAVTSSKGLQLAFPLACEIGRTCEVQNYVDRDPGPDAMDYRCGRETYQAHGGVDIRLQDMAAQRRGVNVLVAAPGAVTRLRDGVADISVKQLGQTAVEGQECGNGVVVAHEGGWEVQYCHMAKGSIIVKAGDVVAAGQPLGQVGLSGNTEYPHLHVTVRKAGVMVDPFAPDSPSSEICPSKAPHGGLWDKNAATAMSYKAGAVLNAGFAATPLTMESIEAGAIPAPTAASGMLLAYVRAINLQGGDVQELTVKAPDGTILATGGQPPLDRAKAQYMFYTGKRAPLDGWKPGPYSATYTVRRGGRAVITQTFSMTL